jgi:hypothetical protein
MTLGGWRQGVVEGSAGVPGAAELTDQRLHQGGRGGDDARLAGQGGGALAGLAALVDAVGVAPMRGAAAALEGGAARQRGGCERRPWGEDSADEGGVLVVAPWAASSASRCTSSIGRAGARQRRRLRTLIAVGWRPPDVSPSGAGRARGARGLCRRITPTRTAPHRGGGSSARHATPGGHGFWGLNGRGRGSQRSLLSNGPQKRPQVPGDGHDHLGGSLPASAQLPRACTPAGLGFPPAVVDGLGHLLPAAWALATALGRRAGGPGAGDQGPAGMRVARLGEAALTAPLSRRVCRGREAPVVQEVSRVLEAGEVRASGSCRHCHWAWDAPQGLEGVDHGGEPPGPPLVCEGLRETLAAFGGLVDGAHVGLADELRRRGGTDSLTEPPEVGRAPGGAARRPAILPPAKRLAAKWGRRQGAADSFPRPTQVTNGLRLTLRDVGVAGPRAPQS